MIIDNIISRLDEFYGVLGKEINWSAEHFDKTDFSPDYKLGFINGLMQARDLLIDFEIKLIKE